MPQFLTLNGIMTFYRCVKNWRMVYPSYSYIRTESELWMLQHLNPNKWQLLGEIINLDLDFKYQDDKVSM